MPYNATSELPRGVKDNLPPLAQDIYKEAFNSAYEEYADSSKRKTASDREETAHKVAWSAVKKKYEKSDDDKWHKKKE